MPDLLKKAHLVNRETFDPTNPIHIESFETFLRTGNWGDVQFYAELPYIEVPMTVLTKFAMHHLGVTPETAEERSARLAAKDLVVVKKSETPEERAARLQKASQMAMALAA